MQIIPLAMLLAAIVSAGHTKNKADYLKHNQSVIAKPCSNDSTLLNIHTGKPVNCTTDSDCEYKTGIPLEDSFCQ